MTNIDKERYDYLLRKYNQLNSNYKQLLVVNSDLQWQIIELKKTIKEQAKRP